MSKHVQTKETNRSNNIFSKRLQASERVHKLMVKGESFELDCEMNHTSLQGTNFR